MGNNTKRYIEIQFELNLLRKLFKQFAKKYDQAEKVELRRSEKVSYFLFFFN
jgi:hypothetical protein